MLDAKYKDWPESLKRALVGQVKASGCGANAQGGGGFQPGNSCASGGVDESGGSPNRWLSESDPHASTHGDTSGLHRKIAIAESWGEDTTGLRETLKQQIDSPEFHEWFDGSQMVDSDGLPLLLYHQTELNDVGSIKEQGFNLGEVRSRSADHEVPDGVFMKMDAKDLRVPGSAQIPLYASIKNPLKAFDRRELQEKIGQISSEYTRIIDEKAEYNRSQNAKTADLSVHVPDEFFAEWEAMELDYSRLARVEATKALRSAGYDGVVLERDEGKPGEYVKTIIALDPSSVKSPDNTGSWDASESSLLKSIDRYAGWPRSLRKALGLSTHDAAHGSALVQPDKWTKRLEALRERRGESGSWRYTCKDCGHVRVDSESGTEHARSEKCEQCGGIAFGGVVEPDGGGVRKATGCGANKRGGGGFQKGNTCAAMTSAKIENKKRVLADGSPLPKHVPNWPPAWTEVQVATDPDADVLVKGRDAKGRPQSIYSEKHSLKQAAKKYAKIRELRAAMPAIAKEIAADEKNGVEAATVLELIRTTGMRPGSTRDTKAAKQAYGASTLLGRHVVIDDSGGVTLKFTGKKGMALEIPVTDKSVKDAIVLRSAGVKPDERLFGVSDSDLRDYAKTKGGGKFTPKDFRTAMGTSTAVKAIKKATRPTTVAEYKKAVKLVAEAVSKQLGNTPTIALQSYIDPSVFTEWRAGIDL